MERDEVKKLQQNEVALFLKNNLHILANNIYRHFPYEPPHEKTDFCICKTKAQISCAVTVQLISAFVFAILYFLNFKPLLCTAWFVKDLVRNPVDQKMF